jgi:ElaB/YqjD/DUF883 family membrane-anchored ribosome-binding protein
MKTTSMQINEDIAALRSDLCRLGADFAELPNRIRSYRRNKIMRSREKLRDAVVGLENRAKDRVRDTSGVLKEQGHYAADKWRGGIEHRPLASIAVAFVAGWLLASAVERRCKCL